MKRTIATILMATLMSATLMSAPVGLRQALGKAMDLAVRKSPRKGGGQVACKKVDSPLGLPFYAFDIGDDEGFVLVAADDRLSPVLGYVDKGHFDMRDMPPYLKAWLEECGDCLAFTGDGREETQSAPAKTLEKPKGAIPPMLSCTWNQQEPYNNSCPDFKNEGKCNTGCLATAMAQVLYYYRDSNVKKLQAAISGYTCATNWPGYGYITVPGVAKGTSIDWGHMLNNYGGEESEQEEKAVADLMFYVAAALKTEFVGASSGYSSAYTTNIPSVLKTQFGYSKSCCLKNREAFSISQWENMIYQELVEQRPVIYIGRSDTYTHGFVVDGYDGDNLYHVNWGWGGLYNGYFNLSVLSRVEGSTYNGYNMSHAAVFDARPAADGDPLPSLTACNLALSDSKMSFVMVNYTGATDSFKFGVAAVLGDGSLSVLKQSSSYVSMNDRGTKSVSFTLAKSDLTSLPKGQYVLKPVFNRKSENEWKLADCSDDYGYQLVWDGSKFSLSYNSPSSNRIFTADAFSFPASPVAGVKVPVSMTLTCTGGEYSDEVYLFASTTSSASTYSSRMGVYLKDGDQYDISLFFSPKTAGTYKVWVATDTGGKNSIGSCKVTVSSSSSKGEVSVVSYDVENAVKSGEWNTVYGKLLKGTLTLKNIGNALFSDIITIWLMEGVTKSRYIGTQSDKVLVTLAPGETMKLDYAYDEGETGHYYQLWLLMGSSVITNGKVRFFELVPGITTYNADGHSRSTAPVVNFSMPADAVAVDMEGAGVSKVVPNTNPNAVYFIGENDATPKGLGSSNVVKAGVAQRIELVDGHSFYTPRSFHANAISYKRTPQRQTSGVGGWETIVLPFTVQKVTTEDRTIDWFHNDNDSGKDFWLKEYALQDTESGTAYFNHVEAFMPHVPYVIAVPSSKWGSEHDLTGKTLCFEASDEEVTADAKLLTQTSVYRFEGTYVQKVFDDAFVLNDSGTSFVRADDAVLMPFRACFVPLLGSGSNANVTIGDFNAINGVESYVVEQDGMVEVYSISGMRMGKVQIRNGHVDTVGLPKGVYIVEGKKMVVR